MIYRSLILLLLCLNIQFCTFLYKPSSFTAREKLVIEINHLLDDSLLTNANVGICIESLKDSQIIFERNFNKLFIPASNQKLYTTAAALQELGPQFTFLTKFYITGSIRDSILKGNLIIQGQGDPTISGRFYNDDVLKLFKDWGDSLKSKGIKKIQGNLVGDESYFGGYKLGKGWNWDDEPFYYSAQISALSFNENCVNLALSAEGSVGDSVKISCIPKTNYISLINHMIVLSPDSVSQKKVWRQRAENIIELQGGLAQGTKDTVSVTIENPPLWFIKTFSDVLHSEGINICGTLYTKSNRDSLSEKNRQLLFTHQSPALSRIVHVVNKKSNNFYAEQLFKTLGAEIDNDGTAKGGAKVIKNWLKNLNVSMDKAITVDGSGLSRMNLVSPFSTAAVLRAMYFSKNFQVYYNSLPVAGKDGTLKKRMNNSVAEGVLRAKTGFVTHVRNLAGYTKDIAGNDYLFVIMVNNYSADTAYINTFQDKIGILLSGFNPD